MASSVYKWLPHIYYSVKNSFWFAIGAILLYSGSTSVQAQARVCSVQAVSVFNAEGNSSGMSFCD